MSGFINISAAMRRYPMSRRTLYNWMNEGRVEFHQGPLGRFVKAADVARMCAERRMGEKRSEVEAVS